MFCNSRIIFLIDTTLPSDINRRDPNIIEPIHLGQYNTLQKYGNFCDQLGNLLRGAKSPRTVDCVCLIGCIFKHKHAIVWSILHPGITGLEFHGHQSSLEAQIYHHIQNLNWGFPNGEHVCVSPLRHQFSFQDN